MGSLDWFCLSRKQASAAGHAAQGGEVAQTQPGMLRECPAEASLYKIELYHCGHKDGGVDQIPSWQWCQSIRESSPAG